MTTLFGIKNCDTIKKARKWLEANEINYEFHDYRADGIEKQWLVTAESQLGWENLLNKRGTTFRQLPENAKINLDCDKAIELMLDNPAMIKRPVLVHQNTWLLGFKIDQYETLFA